MVLHSRFRVAMALIADISIIYASINKAPQAKGSTHRVRVRSQLCKESGQRADTSGLETLETFTGGALRPSARRRNLMILPMAPPRCDPLTPDDALFSQRTLKSHWRAGIKFCPLTRKLPRVRQNGGPRASPERSAIDPRSQ